MTVGRFPVWCAALFGKLFGDRGLHLPGARRAALRRPRARLITKLRKNMRERLLALDRQAAAPQAGDHRERQRPTQERLPDRAHPPSQPVQFPGAPPGGAHRLLPPAQEAFAPPRSGSGLLDGRLELIQNSHSCKYSHNLFSGFCVAPRDDNRVITAIMRALEGFYCANNRPHSETGAHTEASLRQRR